VSVSVLASAPPSSSSPQPTTPIASAKPNKILIANDMKPSLS
jgi:hypothetical protein